MSDFAAGMERWAALMQALARSPPGSPEFQQVLLSLREDLAAQLDAWLRASHPFTGFQFGPPTPPSASTGSAGTGFAFGPGAARIADLLNKWVHLQSQFAAYWSTIGRAAAGKFAARVGSVDGPLTDLRKLYDLWIDCAEEAYAETAHSDGFAHTVAEAINTAVAFQLEGRQSMQQWARAVGLPTREEIDALTRRIEQLEQVRRRSSRPEASHTKASRARPSKGKRRPSKGKRRP
jgi:polyhydroxyalkanoate synthase subunit PhaE